MPPRTATAGTQASKCVIVGGGPAGIHFAKRLKDEGYAAEDITILEAQKRFGGKSFTEFLPEQPNVRHEMGTCYMHLGYEPVRELLEEYGLADSEVGLGDKYLARERKGKQRKVWDLQKQGDYTRADLKGQDFDDWILSTADRREVEGFYNNEEPTPEERLTNIMAAAKEKPQSFLKGLRVLRNTAGDSVHTKIFGRKAQSGVHMSDEEIVSKLDRLKGAYSTLFNMKAKDSQKKRKAGARGRGSRRAADFEDLPVKEIDGARFVVAGLNTVLQIGRYVDEHEKLFGKYKYGLPPKPTDDMMSELNVTFLEWLESKGLYALMPFFVYSQAAQGYGSLEKVPALYGLWWNHPDYIARSIGLSDVTLFAANVVINGVLGIRIPNFVLGVLGRIVQTVLPLLSPLLNRINPSPAAQAVLTSGFSKLWENIVEKEGLEVKLGCAVTNIDRSGPTPVVTYRNSNTGADVTIRDADFVVLAVPLLPAMQGVKAYNKGAKSEEYSEPVVDEVTRSEPIFTPTQEESAVLGTIESYTLKTVLFKADPFPTPGPIYPGEVWAKALEGYGGRVRYLTNSELSTLGTESPGQTGYVAYQALDEPPNRVNDANLQEKFAEDIAAIGLTNVDIVLEKPWYYFPHFPQQAVQNGAPWKLMELQGKHGMLFAGSSCCFESVLDVMAYNELLIEKFVLPRNLNTVDAPAQVPAKASVKS